MEPTDISNQLREYAADSGYSHNDYADTMLAAASEIELCMEMKSNCAKLLSEQDYQYNKQTNELIARHAEQLDVAAEFCRQYQIENKQLKEKLQIRDDQVASKKAVIEEFEIQNNQLKAQSDLDNETNLQLNLEIMTLKAENKKLGDYYMKINSMYWNDEIFEVNHGEGFYTDKFVEMVVDS